MDRQANTQFYFFIVVVQHKIWSLLWLTPIMTINFYKKKKVGSNVKLFLDCLIEKSMIICFDKRMQVHRFIHAIKNLTPEI